VELAKKNGSPGISYTYNEPTIWFEFVLETAKLARDAGLTNVLVTNGYINPEPQAELMPYVDGVNQDIKSIRGDFYKKRCGGKLQPVLDAAKRYRENVLLEVTNLIIPGHNDSEEDISGLRDWIADNLGADTPVHISAYFPRYKLRAKPTGRDIMERAFNIMKERLNYVYVGNMITSDGANSQCASCGKGLVMRRGYGIDVVGLDGRRCAACGAENNFRN
jgi:pyruvate formate lyase activating enzyme